MRINSGHIFLIGILLFVPHRASIYALLFKNPVIFTLITTLQILIFLLILRFIIKNLNFYYLICIIPYVIDLFVFKPFVVSNNPIYHKFFWSPPHEVPAYITIQTATSPLIFLLLPILLKLFLKNSSL